MNKTKDLINFLMIITIIISIFSPAIYAESLESISDTITVDTLLYKNGMVKKISIQVNKNELDDIKNHLIRLNSLIENGDKRGILLELRFLRDKGIVQDNPDEIYNLITTDRLTNIDHKEKPLEENISNYLCYVNAIGNGLMIFTIGQILYLLAKNGVVLPGVIYVVILALTHSIPFRIMLPLGFIKLDNGSTSIIGLKGYQHLIATDKSVAFSLIGFTGLVINFPVNTDLIFLFVSGLSLEVTDKNIFDYTP